MESINHSLLKYIANVNVVQIAADMVKIPSCSLSKNREKDVAEFIFNLLSKEGIQSELTEVEPGRFNVTAIQKGTGTGKSLMLCGHLDTVPAYDMSDPYSGLVKNGRLYGRGACDMKGPLAAMLAAFIGIYHSRIKIQGDLVFAGVIDEEEMGKGIEYLMKNGPFVDAAVIGEPTAMQLAVGHKGLEWLMVDVFGKKVHGGRMKEGINAIAMASKLINRLSEDYANILNEREHPILGSPTINIGRIEGGDQPSTVPGSCTLEIDRRWVPEETVAQVYQEISAIIEDLHKQDPKFNASVKSYFPSGELLPHEPFCTEETDPLVISAKITMSQSGFDNLTSTVFPAWTDAGILAAYTKTKCIVMGPGDLALAHTSNEYIETEELKKASQFYGSLVLNYCGWDK